MQCSEAKSERSRQAPSIPQPALVWGMDAMREAPHLHRAPPRDGLVAYDLGVVLGPASRAGP